MPQPSSLASNSFKNENVHRTSVQKTGENDSVLITCGTLFTQLLRKFCQILVFNEILFENY